jgi:hypothetical protein
MFRKIVLCLIASAAVYIVFSHTYEKIKTRRIGAASVQKTFPALTRNYPQVLQTGVTSITCLEDDTVTLQQMYVDTTNRFIKVEIYDDDKMLQTIFIGHYKKKLFVKFSLVNPGTSTSLPDYSSKTFYRTINDPLTERSYLKAKSKRKMNNTYTSIRNTLFMGRYGTYSYVTDTKEPYFFKSGNLRCSFNKLTHKVGYADFYIPNNFESDETVDLFNFSTLL